jgi:hypothetical protein
MEPHTSMSLRDGVDRALAQALEVNFPTLQAQLHVFPEKIKQLNIGSYDPSNKNTLYTGGMNCFYSPPSVSQKTGGTCR